MKSRTLISFCQRPVLNPCHGEITSSDVIGCTIAIAICSSPYFCLCTNQQPQAPVALGQSKKRAGVACDHEFLVSGNDPSRDFAFLSGYPRISANVGSCVEFHAQPGRSLANSPADFR